MDNYDHLRKLKELLDTGAINEDEFNQMKKPLIQSFNEKANNSEAASPYTVQPVDSYKFQDSAQAKGATTSIKILSFLIPLVGLILFIVDKDKNPDAAKDELMWAGIGFGIGLFLSILSVA